MTLLIRILHGRLLYKSARIILNDMHIITRISLLLYTNIIEKSINTLSKKGLFYILSIDNIPMTSIRLSI